MTTPKLLEEVVRVPINEVHIIRKIGEGAFGEVSYANVESHGLVAVKWLKVRWYRELHTAECIPRHGSKGCVLHTCQTPDCPCSHERQRDRFAKYSESFMREAEVLAKLNHPNIIRMYGVVIEPVMEWNGSGGSGGLSGNLDSGSSRESSRHAFGAGEQPVIIAGIMTDFVRGGSLSGQLR